MTIWAKLKKILTGEYHHFINQCKGQRVYDISEPWPDNDMMPPPLDAQTAFDELCKYFLGDEYWQYVTVPVNTKQCNSLLLYYIMINNKGDKKYMKKLEDYYGSIQEHSK